MRRIVLAVGLGGAVVLGVGAPLRADVELWRQNPYYTVGGWASQDARNPGGIGFFAETADNFAATGAWGINSVEFWGGYVSVTPGNTHGFTVRFYGDSGGSVGTMLSMQDVLTFTETPYYTNAMGQVGYHYTVTLPQTVTLPGAGMYWISVVAILDRGGTANEPQWGWAQALQVNPPPAEQWFFSATHAFAPQSGDTAFVLSGTNGAPAGVCCRGATCNVGVGQAGCTTSGVLAGASFASAAATCNAGGVVSTPCCYADYNKVNGIGVQDIFDFLNDWFAGSRLAVFGGDGVHGTPNVQGIFDFLNAWFGGCA
jgi:hypothetical protein